MREQRLVLGEQRQLGRRGRTVQVAGISLPGAAQAHTWCTGGLQIQPNWSGKQTAGEGLVPRSLLSTRTEFPGGTLLATCCPFLPYPGRRDLSPLSLWVAHSLPPHMTLWNIFAFRGNTISAVSHVVRLVGQTLPQPGEPNV